MPVPRKSVLDQWDRDHSWHPFAQMAEYLSHPPLHIASGQGVWLEDAEGNRYLDGSASIWTNVHGHNDPELNAALTQQLQAVAHSTMFGLSHPVGAELARQLVVLAPGDMTRCFFSDNGTNAVEIALKMSFQYWQLQGRTEKCAVIGMEHAYHGDSIGTMAVGDSRLFHGRFRPWFLPARHFRAPLCREIAGQLLESSSEDSLADLDRLLESHGHETACVILEPSIQGAAGMRLQPPGFTSAVAELCRKHGVHLVLDEVFVGFGRTGPMLVCAEEKVTPDFLCLAKGLTAGYLPLAATVVRESIYEAFLGPYDSYRAFFHGHTFTGNPLAAAVALKSIQKLDTMIAAAEWKEKMAGFGQLLQHAFTAHPCVADVRQRGFAAAIDLAPADGGREFPPARRVGVEVSLSARRHGLLLRPLGNSLLLVPPLCATADELEFLVSRTLRAIEDALDSAPASTKEFGRVC